MPHAEFKIYFNNVQETEIIFKSLLPELKQRIPKTTITLEKEDHVLNLTITARDLSALRAACNSYLRWINTARDVHHQL